MNAKIVHVGENCTFCCGKLDNNTFCCKLGNFCVEKNQPEIWPVENNYKYRVWGHTYTMFFLFEILLEYELEE